MNTAAEVEEFLGSKTLAVVGVSRKRVGFGYTVFKDLKKKGYLVYPVNPHADNVDGEQCYSGVTTLPQRVDGVVAVVPPEQTEAVVREMSIAGIRRVWIQQGAESDVAITFCREHGISVVADQCIMMFARPTAAPHRVHRFVRGVMRKLPK